MNYMLLLPGVHEIKLTGDGRYSFRAIPLGPPKPGFEIEPNDGKLGPSQRLRLGETVRGSLDKAMVSGASDIDQYRFALKKRGKYRITLVSPDDQGVQARLYLNGGKWFSHKENTTAGSTLEYSALLLAGEYIIEITNQDKKRALDEYSLQVEALPEVANVNGEPNDIVGFGTQLSASGTTTAHLGAFDHSDCYTLAATAQPSSVEAIMPDKYQLKFLSAGMILCAVLSSGAPSSCFISRPQRLAGISVSHLYNLKHSRTYQRARRKFEKTRSKNSSIGERRKPQPNGQPGYIRVETGHQGDQDGVKGLYHINAVDEITQFDIVCAVEKISEHYLIPVLEQLLDQFPFIIVSFHPDNGSEYINQHVVKLLKKLLIELTKSRARHSNDNALVESKNGSIVRKQLGYSHIQQHWALLAGQFHQHYLNPYINYHRPCFFPVIKTNARASR